MHWILATLNVQSMIPIGKITEVVIGPWKIREEARRADPVKHSDTEIRDQEKSFGRKQLP